MRRRESETSWGELRERETSVTVRLAERHGGEASLSHTKVGRKDGGEEGRRKEGQRGTEGEREGDGEGAGRGMDGGREVEGGTGRERRREK